MKRNEEWIDEVRNEKRKKDGMRALSLHLSLRLSPPVRSRPLQTPHGASSTHPHASCARSGSAAP